MSAVNQNAFVTYVAGEALAINRRVRFDGSGEIVYADVSERWIGTVVAPVADGDPVTIRLRNSPGTVFMVASAAITALAAVYEAADGKVSSTAAGAFIGWAREAAAADGDNIEIVTDGGQTGPKVVAAGIHSWAGGAATTDSIAVTGLVATDVVIATLAARASTETLVLVANDAGNDQIDLTLSANGTNTTTKINYLVLRLAGD